MLSARELYDSTVQIGENGASGLLGAMARSGGPGGSSGSGSGSGSRDGMTARRVELLGCSGAQRSQPRQRVELAASLVRET
jgi:hypothetical protein